MLFLIPLYQQTPMHPLSPNSNGQSFLELVSIRLCHRVQGRTNVDFYSRMQRPPCLCSDRRNEAAKMGPTKSSRWQKRILFLEVISDQSPKNTLCFFTLRISKVRVVWDTRSVMAPMNILLSIIPKTVLKGGNIFLLPFEKYIWKGILHYMFKKNWSQ